MVSNIIFVFLEPFKDNFRIIEILYGLALWNIYRAKNEAALTSIILPADEDPNTPSKETPEAKLESFFFFIEPGGKDIFNDM
ncbi:hypothetical protein AYI70_g8842 [Smittium culicis]|uniref:Uncharacterized protein n=1 Tax=Smittium culicis TaxID=133412 RepID=A0A1R1XE53_9FUNG|nr:hypothetical protein AYI70_g8842 [Smittium culicis]